MIAIHGGKHFVSRSFVVASLLSILWFGLGLCLSHFYGNLADFFENWLRLQGLFIVGAAVFLNLVVKNQRLEGLDVALRGSEAALPGSPRLKSARGKRLFCLGIGSVGTLSLIQLGFPADGPLLAYFWLTAGIVSFLAGPPTWHVVEILRTSQGIFTAPIDFFSYSPGETFTLRKFGQYCAFYGLAITVAYVFAFTGTLAGHWRADPTFVSMVQAFWPLIYVPICSLSLAYPHIMIYRRVREEKDKVIGRIQSQIGSIIERTEALTREDVERINVLADLMRQIEKSPSYAFSIPIAMSTLGTLTVNLASVLLPRELIREQLQVYFQHYF